MNYTVYLNARKEKPNFLPTQYDQNIKNKWENYQMTHNLILNAKINLNLNQMQK